MRLGAVGSRPSGSGTHGSPGQAKVKPGDENVGLALLPDEVGELFARRFAGDEEEDRYDHN
jgi:hypothetical protein